MTSPELTPGALRTEVLPPNASLPDLLHSFDRMRRQIAIATTGRDGAFAGFDRLEISSAFLTADHGEVIAYACATNDDGPTQTVRYFAHEADLAGSSDSAQHPILVEGIGRTVALAPRVRQPTDPTSDGPEEPGLG